MTSLVDEPDGALRVDFLTGDPLVVLLSDGGTFVHALADEILAYDRQLQSRARSASGAPVPAAGHSGVRSAPWAGSDDVRALLHEAQVIVRRELRLVLTEDGTRSRGRGPD